MVVVDDFLALIYHECQNKTFLRGEQTYGSEVAAIG
jgi:hypothetical protein